MDERSKLPPGSEPLRSDWFIEKLGRSQQQVMSLTVQNRQLKARAERAEARVEELEDAISELRNHTND